MATKLCLNTIPTRSPLSRELILFSATSRPSSCSYSPDGRVSAALSSSAPLRVRHLSFGVTDFDCRHPHLGFRVSTFGLEFGGLERAQMATGRGAAGSGVEAETESTNKDREILVQHLLVGKHDLELLTELQRQIVVQGVDFGALAKEHSTCPSRASGGMIGWVKLGQTDPAFEEAVFGAPLNEVVVVKTKHGFHLVQVLNERKRHFLEQMQVEQLHERLQDGAFLEDSQLVDVREPDEIATAAIKGFEAYPLSQFGKWAPNVKEDLDVEKVTYVLCHHGVRSMQAAKWLQSQGFQRLYNISGGIHAYSTRVDNSIPTY